MRSAMASTSKSAASTSGNEQMARTTAEDRKDPGHGFMYQTKLLMLFVHRGLLAGHTFRLATEMESAKKFSNLVYEYTDNERKIYRLLQTKHKLNNQGDERITHSSLTEGDGDYSLVKYFFSYREIKEEKQFKGAKIQDVIVFTNIDFDHENLAKNNITLEIVNKLDGILSMSNDHNLSRTPLLYRFGPDIIPILEKNFENHNLTKLARQLVKCLLRCEVIKHHVEPFKSCHIILAKEVINTRTSNFQSNFLAECSPEDENCSLEETTLRFRTIFKQVFEEETDDKIKFEDLNVAINEGREVKSKKIGLKFSKNFGSKTVKKNKKDSSENALPEEEAWPKNAISSDEIKDFFDHLVFAVNQPNEDELGDIIRREIGKAFDEDWTQNMYSKFKTNALRLSQGKEKTKWSPSSDWKKFFDDEQEKLKPFFFDIKDPISLFTGREEQLNNLHQMLFNPESAAISQKVCVSGLGGVGKTELVRKYISLHKSDFDNKVIWLNAESPAKLSESFEKLARKELKISLINSHDQSPRTIKLIVKDVYTHFSAAKSLFIFDNFDPDENLGVDGIKDFFPCSSLPHKPHVIITSRCRELGPIPVISLDILTNEQAMELIRKALKIESDTQDNEISLLAETLQFYPLALQQAFAYINVKDTQLKNIGQKFDIRDYLNRFITEPRQLLDFRLPMEGDDTYAKTTFTTWNSTVEKIRNYPGIGEIAIDILNIMVFLGTDDIPTRMFLPMCDNETLVERAVELLKQFSMVSSGTEPSLLRIHRLVQLVTKFNLSENDEEILRHACKLSLSFVSRFGKNSEKSLRQKFVAHLDIILSNLDEWCYVKNTDQKLTELHLIAPLLSTISREFNETGDSSSAVVLQKRELAIREKYLGLVHIRVAGTLCSLAKSFIELGERTQVKDLLRRALRIIKETHYGLKNMESLKEALRNNTTDYKSDIIRFHVVGTFVELAIASINLGNFTKADEWFERIMMVSKNKALFESVDVETADTPCTLAFTHRGLDKFTKAKELLEEALRIKERDYGSDHVQVADILFYLANSLTALGEFTKAKESLEQALKIKETHYGSDHIQVADILSSLADCLIELGEFTKAEESLERVVRINENHYGSDHDKVANTLCILTDCLIELDDYTKATESLERALRIKDSYYGSDFVKPEVDVSKSCELDNLTKAKICLEAVLEFKELLYGSRHVEVADTLCILADTLKELGDYTQANQLLERALDIQETHNGSDHLQVADALCNLAHSLKESGELVKARDSLERALRIKETHYGSDHIQVADVILNLADCLKKLNDMITARELLERALRIKDTHYGSNHIQAADILCSLADSSITIGHFTEAKDSLEQALKIKETHYGSNHIQVADTLSKLAESFLILNDFIKAKELLERALRINETHYGCDHDKVADTLFSLAYSIKKLGEVKIARQLCERASNIIYTLYGSSEVPERVKDLPRSLVLYQPRNDS